MQSALNVIHHVAHHLDEQPIGGGAQLLIGYAPPRHDTAASHCPAAPSTPARCAG
jgi:hypothetical protein